MKLTAKPHSTDTESNDVDGQVARAKAFAAQTPLTIRTHKSSLNDSSPETPTFHTPNAAVPPDYFDTALTKSIVIESTSQPRQDELKKSTMMREVHFETQHDEDHNKNTVKESRDIAILRKEDYDKNLPSFGKNALDVKNISRNRGRDEASTEEEARARSIVEKQMAKRRERDNVRAPPQPHKWAWKPMPGQQDNLVNEEDPRATALRKLSLDEDLERVAAGKISKEVSVISNDGVHVHVLVCFCGNEMMDDSLNCRKCGESRSLVEVSMIYGSKDLSPNPNPNPNLRHLWSLRI